MGSQSNDEQTSSQFKKQGHTGQTDVGTHARVNLLHVLCDKEVEHALFALLEPGCDGRSAKAGVIRVTATLYISFNQVFIPWKPQRCYSL